MRTITLPLRCLAIGIVYFCCTPWASSGDYSYVDLYTLQAPSGYDTVATGVGYPTAAFGQVAGAARLVGGTGNQAIVWGGSTGSATVLSPPFFTDSIANATNGSQQVGNGAGAPTGAAYHALLWSGSVAS